MARSTALRAIGEDSDKRGMEFPSYAVCMTIIVGGMWLSAGMNAAGCGHCHAVRVSAVFDA